MYQEGNTASYIHPTKIYKMIPTTIFDISFCLYIMTFSFVKMSQTDCLRPILFPLESGFRTVFPTGWMKLLNPLTHLNLVLERKFGFFCSFYRVSLCLAQSSPELTT